LTAKLNEKLTSNYEGVVTDGWTNVNSDSGIMKPKNFWALNGSRWPSIKPLATKIFSLVTSTASSERSWSTQGYIHSKIRSCLGNEKVNKLVFVKSNSQLLDPPPRKASREESRNKIRNTMHKKVCESVKKISKYYRSDQWRTSLCRIFASQGGC
jgi:hypothetical protein